MDSLLAPRFSWGQLAFIAIAMLVANEIFYRIGRRHRAELREARKSQTDIVVAALLTLLGLLLAFTFDIGESRFDKRKELVLDEANVIVATYLRANMLPAPHDERVHELLRDYVELRRQARTPEALERVIERSDELHTELWAEATVVARANPDSPVIALFVASLNKMIDLQEARVTVALFQRIPPGIFDILFLVSLLSLGVVGFRAGLDRVRGLLPAVVLVVVIMAVLAMIRAIDEPTSRLFRISKHALDDAQTLMVKNPTLSSSADHPNRGG